MNFHNAKLNAFALQQLELGPTDRVLEIGFGGGSALHTLIARTAFVAGVDRSHDVVERAKTTFAKAVAQRRAEFCVGTVEAIPFESESFGKALTVNTVYFWHSLERGFTEIGRVLKPGGRLVIGFLPKVWMDRKGMPTDIFTSRTSEEIMTTLTRLGFADVVEQTTTSAQWNVVIATR
jgi:ubiquinone/menaquinone biosynthesis C-methylase UbiE